MPAIIGIRNRKTIVVPCIVNSALYVCGEISVLSACDSCRRISRASTPPTVRKTHEATMYIRPMRLWSVVVSQEIQPVPGRLTSWATISGTALTAGAGAICVVAM